MKLKFVENICAVTYFKNANKIFRLNGQNFELKSEVNVILKLQPCNQSDQGYTYVYIRITLT